MREVATLFGVCVPTVARWISSGVRGRVLRSYVLGGKRRIRRADIDAWLAACQGASHAV
jgi:excisionase family DNA binding protein